MEAIYVFERVKGFVKKETVLCIAAVIAVMTMFIVPPDGEYVGYIDVRVLCLLLCLMAVVAGLNLAGVFRWLIVVLLSSIKNGRLLGVTLVLMPFFISMLVTNDVGLILFVPFTLALLEQIRLREAAVPILVLQTVAANLGSMATPVGNPQNLFLYATFDLSIGEFLSAMLPLTFISMLCLIAASYHVLPEELPEIKLKEAKIEKPGKVAVYALLFVVCLLTVFKVVHYGITTVIVLVAIAVLDTKLLKELDFALLATFVCFFVVSGNLGRVEFVRAFLQMLLDKNALLTATGASQVISNVPAAVLLSNFTSDWRSLIQGVNIGGLGTPIASLASLITLKLYMRWPTSHAGHFIKVFMIANIAGLVILLTFASFLL